MMLKWCSGNEKPEYVCIATNFCSADLRFDGSVVTFDIPEKDIFIVCLT